MPREEKAGALRNAPGKKTILVIDDSEIVLGLVRTTLESAGFRVITQSRTAGAVALILQEKPDLVLLDVNMPNIGGDTIAKLFGKAQANSDTIVLLHSSLPEETLKARVLASGAHGYVQKTDDTFELLREINRWLKVGAHGSQSKMRVSSQANTDDDASGSGPRLVARPAQSLDAGDGGARTARRTSGTTALDLPLVLFIDDDMSTLSAFRREVQSEPYTVEFALSGAQAIRRIHGSPPPTLVVSDLLMPEPAGPEVYRQAILKDPTYRDRFIFVTGASGLRELNDFLASFHGTVLHKPVSGEALRNAIRARLSYGVKTSAL